jgi:hypothetical protein
MKYLILATVISVFFVSSIFSQSTPKPPKTNKSSSYSFTFDTDDKEENSSVSIKRNDNIYKLTARFHESKTGSIKKLLVDKLGNSNLTVSGEVYRWIKKENGEKLYDCKLTENNLKIYVDKEFANSKFIDMMNEFGVVLKDAISGSDSKEDEKKENEKELKRAERALSKAKRELERIKRKFKKSN